MPRYDEAREADRLSRLSLRKLGAYAMEEELIEGIEIRKDRVTILQGDVQFVLPPGQASTFLIGMLRGRSWFFEEETPPTSTGVEQSEKRVADTSETAFESTLESTLDSLLEFARDVHLIQDFEKDKATRTVRIDIPACSTTLSYSDAMGYLFDCLQDEVRKSRREPS